MIVCIYCFPEFDKVVIRFECCCQACTRSNLKISSMLWHFFWLQYINERLMPLSRTISARETISQLDNVTSHRNKRQKQITIVINIKICVSVSNLYRTYRMHVMTFCIQNFKCIPYISKSGIHFALIWKPHFEFINNLGLQLPPLWCIKKICNIAKVLYLSNWEERKKE